MVLEIAAYGPETVRLLDGPLLRAQKAGQAYLLDLDADRLLAPYRREAGLKQTVQSYPNWENTGLDGHISGHYLSALVAFWQATGESVFVERISYMLEQLQECQDAIIRAHGDDDVMSGFIGGVPKSRELFTAIGRGEIHAQNFDLNGSWVPLYNLHKIFAGLLDVWAAFDGKSGALGDLSACARTIVLRLAQWWMRLTQNLTDEQFNQILVCEFGGMAEIFAELSRRENNERYLSEALRFTDHKVMDPLARGEDTLTGMHANTQIPKVLGWERIAHADLERFGDYYDAALTFFTSVAERRSVSIGAHSVREHFHPENDFSSMIQSEQGPETCNSYNMSKLASRLWLDDPQMRYMDFYERVQLNHIASTINDGADGQDPGFVYFTSMRPQHYRVRSTVDNCFWCCVGSGLENHARYGRMIYARSHDVTLINQFIPSALTLPDLTVRQKMGKSQWEMVVNISTPSHVKTIAVRCPWWSKNISVTAGDEFTTVTVEGTGVNGENPRIEGYRYFTIKWDKAVQEATINIALNPRMTSQPMPDGSPWVSYMYGPYVLAWANGADELEGLYADDSRMGHVAAGPLRTFKDLPIVSEGVLPSEDDLSLETSRGRVQLQQFNQIGNERYTVYFPSAAAGQEDAVKQKLAEIDAQEYRDNVLTIDVVHCGEQQPEKDHNYRGSGDAMGHEAELHYRSVPHTDAWFSYDFTFARDAAVIEVTTFGSTLAAPMLVLDGHNVMWCTARKEHQGNGIYSFALTDAMKLGENHTVRIQALANKNFEILRVVEVRIMRGNEVKIE